MSNLKEWLVFAGVVVTAVSGILGIVLKSILNGTAQRTKDIVHKVDTGFHSLDSKIDIISSSVHALDVRVARIEGARWQRREDSAS